MRFPSGFESDPATWGTATARPGRWCPARVFCPGDGWSTSAHTPTAGRPLSRRCRCAGDQVGTAAHVTGTCPLLTGLAPGPRRLAMPLDRFRCQHAGTNRAGQVTDRRITTGQADTTDQAGPLMGTANMTSHRRPGTSPEGEAHEPEPVRRPGLARRQGAAEVPDGQARAVYTGGGEGAHGRHR